MWIYLLWRMVEKGGRTRKEAPSLDIHHGRREGVLPLKAMPPPALPPKRHNVHCVPAQTTLVSACLLIEINECPLHLLSNLIWFASGIGRESANDGFYLISFIVRCCHWASSLDWWELLSSSEKSPPSGSGTRSQRPSARDSGSAVPKNIVGAAAERNAIMRNPNVDTTRSY